MSNRFMISVATLALIAGTGLANAQGGMKGGESGGAATQHSAPADSTAAPSRSDSAPGAAKSESTEPSKGGMKATQSDKSPGATKNQSAQDTGKDTAKDKGGMTNQRADDNMKNGTKSEGRDGMKAEGRDSKSGTNAAETRDRDNNMKAEGRDSKSGTNAAETKGTTDRQQTTIGQAGAGAKLTTEQRTKITTVIHSQHVENVTNVKFSLNVGTRVPREGVSFHPLPAEVVTIYPEWRGYEFILVNGRIVIIEPSTYEIVAIIDA